MKKYFGFEVKVSNVLYPEENLLLKSKLAKFISSENIDLANYKIYLHQLVILAEESHFGLSGGLPARVENVLLKFSVNQKQRRENDIIFRNNLLEEQSEPDIKEYCLPFELCYTIPPSYFMKQQQFQNVIVTLVRSDLRESFKKIKVSVSAQTKKSFMPHLKSEMAAYSITKLDLELNKSVEFSKQIELNLGYEEKVASMAKKENSESTTNIFNINQATAVSVNGDISATGNTNNTVPTQHIINELKHLQLALKQDEVTKDKKLDLDTLNEAIVDAEKNREFLPKLRSIGSWVGDKAEKIGVTIAAAALKGQIGI